MTRSIPAGLARAAAAVPAAALLALTACGSEPTRPAAESPAAAGAEVGDPDAPTGLRDDAPDGPTLVDGTDSGEIDLVAAAALDDLTEFWEPYFTDTARRPFRPITRAVSWDARTGDGPLFCGAPTDGIVNAGYCAADDEIGWDRGVLMAGVEQEYGPLAVVTILAHEYGHVLQDRFDASAARRTPTVVLEQQADCYAGAFVRHVVDGDAARLSASSTDGLDQALWAMVGTRDHPDDDYFSGAEHGTGFERVTAFGLGFDTGAGTCADLDAGHVDRIRGQIPEAMLFGRGPGPREVTAEHLTAVVDSLSVTLGEVPGLRIDDSGQDVGCGPVTAAQYCPEAGVLAVDLDGLAALADPAPVPEPEAPAADSHWAPPTSLAGPFTPWAVVASRYGLALADAEGAPLTGTEAARTAICLTGTWTGELARGTSTGSVPGAGPYDLDETIAAVLDDGPVATDAADTGQLSGYERLGALRAGVLDGPDACR